MKKIKIWTKDYRPFILGGNVHQPMATEAEASGPFALGKGYEGYVVLSPLGESFVAESKTGALVGPTLNEVRADIKKAKKSVMKKQIIEAQESVKAARIVDPAEFWKRLR
jgi:hypothetical protein